MLLPFSNWPDLSGDRVVARGIDQGAPMNQPPARPLSLGVLGTSSKENEYRLLDPPSPRRPD
jgi:hypothetical protein